MPMISRVVVALLLVPLWAHSQSAASDAEWKQFITWVQATNPDQFRGRSEQLAGYKAKVMAEGMSASDAEDLSKRLMDRTNAGRDPDWQAFTFNRMYSSNNGRLTTAPNAFLVETVKRLRPGKALDIGMGTGRNTIFLAQQGWDVTGLDVSDVGIALAKENARHLGLRINAVVKDVGSFDLGTAQWDLVCFLYFPIPEALNDLHQRITTALKPGGYVIIEGLGGRGDVDALLQAWEKWKPMKLTLVRLEYGEGKSDWGSTGRVSRILLQRP